MSEPATIRRDGTVLGFDVGSRRIGVAIGSSFGTHARAIAVVDVHGNGPDWTAVERLIKEWRPDGLVVGDPLTLDGQDQPNRKRAQEELIKQAKGTTPMRLAQGAARTAIEQSFAMPLKAAGIDAKVTARFANASTG